MPLTMPDSGLGAAHRRVVPSARQSRCGSGLALLLEGQERAAGAEHEEVLASSPLVVLDPSVVAWAA